MIDVFRRTMVLEKKKKLENSVMTEFKDVKSTKETLEEDKKAIANFRSIKPNWKQLQGNWSESPSWKQEKIELNAQKEAEFTSQKNKQENVPLPVVVPKPVPRQSKPDNSLRFKGKVAKKFELSFKKRSWNSARRFFTEEMFNECIRNVKLFGEVEEIKRNWRNFFRLTKFLCKNKLPPKSLLNQFRPLKLREAEKKPRLKLLKNTDVIFSKKRVNKPQLIKDGFEPEQTRYLTDKVNNYCNKVFELANEKLDGSVISKPLVLYTNLVQRNDSKIAADYAKWLVASHLAKILKVRMRDFTVRKNKQAFEFSKGMYDFLGLAKRKQWLQRIAQGIDNHFDMKNWRKKPRNYTLPKIDSKLQPFRIRINANREFENIINEEIFKP